MTEAIIPMKDKYSLTVPEAAVYLRFNTAINLIKAAIYKKNGGVKLIFGGFCDTIQPNNRQMATLKVEMGKLNENT